MDTPQLCYKLASECVRSFTFENHTYVGCTTDTADHTYGHPWCSHVAHFVWNHSKWSYCLQVPCSDTHATLYTPEGMRRSVLLNLIFVAVGLLVGGISHTVRAATRTIARQQPLQQRCLVVAGGRQMCGFLPSRASQRTVYHESYTHGAIEMGLVYSMELYGVLTGLNPIEEGKELHSTALNYLVFLRNSRDMFLSLTAVSLLIVMPVLGRQTFLFGCFDGPISLMEECQGGPKQVWEPLCRSLAGPFSGLAQDASPIKLGIVCLIALTHGLIVLVFTSRFNHHCAMGHRMYAERCDARARFACYFFDSKLLHAQLISWQEDFDLINRTVWLTHLPSGDFQTREAWRLNNEDLQQVEQDLKEAMLRLRPPTRQELPNVDLSEAIEAVHVTPVVTEWHHVVNQVKHYEPQQSMQSCTVQEAVAQHYALRLSFSRRKRFCQPLWQIEQWWFERQKELCYGRVEKLREEQTKHIYGPKMLSGSAFVVFQNEDLKKCLTGPTPSCFTCRNYTYWRFGRAPFTSVTLRCLRAPHPSDLNWDNLQVTEANRGARRRFGYITDVRAPGVPCSENCTRNLILHIVQQHADALEKRLSHVWWWQRFMTLTGFNAKFQLHSEHLWAMLAEQVPTITLVLINSLLLPPLIYQIAGLQKCAQKTYEEKTQLHLNYIFLVINQIAIPLLGLSGLPALVMIVSQEVQSVKDLGDRGLPWAEACLAALFSSPAAFSIKYLLNCAFMTSANSLMNLPQLVYRYWYAFGLGIVALGFGMGIYVPSLLPCAAMFFTLRLYVDAWTKLREDHLMLQEGCFDEEAEGETE
eukprot:g27999.t1